jgi:nitrogenase-stabilizing/protective protein
MDQLNKETLMGVLDDLRQLSAAEDIFDYLHVSFERRTVNVARLHILRRMGEYLAKDGLAGLPESEIFARCKGHLEAAYADFLKRTPIDERVFKVHKDAVKERPVKPKFVTLTSFERKD